MRAVTLARKPEGCSTTQSVLEHECGGLNIDVCRIPNLLGGSPSVRRRLTSAKTGIAPVFSKDESRGFVRLGDPGVYMMQRSGELIGRWPANVLLQHGPNCVQTIKEERNSLESVVEYDCVCGLSNASLLLGTCKQVQ